MDNNTPIPYSKTLAGCYQASIERVRRIQHKDKRQNLVQSESHGYQKLGLRKHVVKGYTCDNVTCTRKKIRSLLQRKVPHLASFYRPINGSLQQEYGLFGLSYSHSPHDSVYQAHFRPSKLLAPWHGHNPTGVWLKFHRATITCHDCKSVQDWSRCNNIPDLRLKKTGTACFNPLLVAQFDLPNG